MAKVDRPDDFFTKSWRERKVRAQEGQIAVRFTAGRIQVWAPYRPDFLAGAHALGGRWRHRSKMWSFSLARRDDVFKLLKRTHGWKLTSKIS